MPEGDAVASRRIGEFMSERRTAPRSSPRWSAPGQLRNHLHSIYRKLDVRSQQELIQAFRDEVKRFLTPGTRYTCKSLAAVHSYPPRRIAVTFRLCRRDNSSIPLRLTGHHTVVNDHRLRVNGKHLRAIASFAIGRTTH